MTVNLKFAKQNYIGCLGMIYMFEKRNPEICFYKNTIQKCYEDICNYIKTNPLVSP